MGKFSQILFTSDFDHTLSGMDNTVPQRNIDAIRRFIAEDGRFCMNSGRSLLLLRPKLSDVPVNAPCICYNGAACYDFAAERLDYAVPLPDDAPELLQKILALGEDFGVEIQCLDRHYSFRSSARDQFLQQQGLPLVRAETLPPLPWMKLVVCLAHDVDVLGGAATPEQAARMTALQQQIAALGGGRYYAVRSLPLLMEIGPCGCDKGKAARRLADSLGRRMLREVYDRRLPDTMEELLKLPGVGRKTANLLLGDVYGQPAVVCDTHCIRIANRLGLAEGKEPEKVERQLRAILPPEESSDFCHRIVLFGREVCTARAPHCAECPLRAFCTAFSGAAE